jgi:DNA-binding CsgD family transcriptional regulator
VERFSDSEKAELWDRFEAGESLRSISRVLGRTPSSVRTHVVAAGWRRPVPAGDWCGLRLSFREREEISRGVATGVSLRCIARRLGRSASTVSREVAGNGGRLRYRAGVVGACDSHPRSADSLRAFRSRSPGLGGGESRSLNVSACLKRGSGGGEHIDDDAGRSRFGAGFVEAVS